MTSARLGSRTTAEEALRGVSLQGAFAVVTGASSGIGAEAARVLAQAGARVIMACRSMASGEEVATAIRASLASGAPSVEVKPLDLTDLASVRALADEVLANGRPIELLINNAGVMATPLGKTKQGSELQVGTNHLGHFLLTKLLLPALARATQARVVNLSSALHYRGRGARLLETLTEDPGYERRTYTPFDAYGDSKLANVLFTRHLARVAPRGVATFSLHPGVIPTNLTRSMGLLGAAYRFVGKPFLKSIPQGAATTIYAATAPELAEESGAYLSDCGVARSSREGRDEALAEKLWEVSESLVADFAA